MGKEIKQRIAEAEELFWLNESYVPTEGIGATDEITLADIDQAEALWQRFAPLLAACFPETAAQNGQIESPLKEIPLMQQRLAQRGQMIPGRLLLKMDSHLAIAGSVKARGGIYEVLKHTEQLALTHGLLTKDDDYRKLLNERDFFSRYTIQVGSTGNLGLSIGTIAAALGYQAVVHMSADAKPWKKELLRLRGVTVKEYDGDYSVAVQQGRQMSRNDPYSHFVDDEQSKELFLGYATAAWRLDRQLAEMGIAISAEQPLVVYLPCGVGGAPGGISYGLKSLYGQYVHCFFVEPTQCPCMLLGMATGQYERIAVGDVGLSGQTAADGLAVGRPSALVSRLMRLRLSGIFSVSDEVLFAYLKQLADTEGIAIEPSACAGFAGAVRLPTEGKVYLQKQQLDLNQAVQIVWATGGALVPATEMAHYMALGTEQEVVSSQ